MASVRDVDANRGEKIPQLESPFWRRTTNMAIAMLIGDEAVEKASLLSSSVGTFFTETLPRPIAAAFYIVPAVVTVVPTLIQKCRKRPRPIENEDESERLLAIEKLAEIKPVNEEQKAIFKSAVNATDLQTKKESLNGINNFINASYLYGLRGLKGVFILIQMYDLASQDTNDKVTNGVDTTYDVLADLYMLALLVRSLRTSTKKPKKEVLLSEVKATKFAAKAPTKTPDDVELPLLDVPSP